MIEYKDWKRLLAGVRLPAAIVDLDAFDRNAALCAGHASGAGKTLRLATKSVRVPELIRRALGRGFRGLMCYSAEEAKWLAGQGFDDLLVAYPTLQPSDLAALRELHEQGRLVWLVADCAEQLQAIARAMAGAKDFRIVAELDLALRPLGGRAHLGVRRSPLRTEQDLRAFLREARKWPELRVAGVMAYEAQVAGLGDRNPFKRWLNPVAALVRRLSVRAVAERRARVRGIFEAEGARLELFNGGGSGSLNLSAREETLTSFAAGSGLLDPHLFDYYSNIRFEPACFFALQAVRRSDPGFVTCQGGGYIASGEPGWDRVPLPWLPEGAKLVGSEGCGEVQTPLRLRAPGDVALGDPVLFRHAKAGELAERFTEYLLVSGEKIVGRAPTYRGLGLCFFF